MPSVGVGLTLTWQPRSRWAVASVHSPNLTWFSKLTNWRSPACLTTSVSSTVWILHRVHAADSKTNLEPNLPRLTGGSWKKSPQRINWSPPNGRGSIRTVRAISSRTSKSLLSNMDTSSTIRTWQVYHRATAVAFVRTFYINFWRSPMPAPMPLNECSVMPWMWLAATPVDAVIATFWAEYFTKSVWIKYRRR